MSRRVRTGLQLAGAALMALLVAAAPISAELGRLATGERQVDCCCGEHAADHPCGCIDCPAAIDQRAAGWAEQDDDLHHTALRGCGSQPDKQLTINLIPKAVFTEPAMAPPPLSVAVPPAYAAPPGSRVVAVVDLPS
jgi:hypothetical protein